MPSRSPLENMSAELAAAPGLARIEEVVPVEQINLRGNSGSGGFLAAVRTVVGGDLPIAPNTFAHMDAFTAVWLGPDEWLVLGPAGGERERSLETMLRRSLAGQHVSVVDVSDCRTILELSGPKARDVLMKGCGLDLHPRNFKTGQSAQTLLARVPIVLLQLGDAPRYRILVANSLAQYTAKWLCDAAGEYVMSRTSNPALIQGERRSGTLA